MKNRTVKDTRGNRTSLFLMGIDFNTRPAYKDIGKLFIRVSANDYSRIIKAGLVTK